MLDYIRAKWRPALFAARPVRYALLAIGIILMSTISLFSSRIHTSLLPLMVELEPEIKLKILETPVPGLEDAGGFHPNPVPEIDVRLQQPIDPETKRANATLLMLCRNSDIEGVIKSMKSLEGRFNHEHEYPWTFLNEVPFTTEFMKRVQEVTNASIEFGVVPNDHWFQPDWINETLAEENRVKLSKTPGPWPIPYALSVSYRNMCRFNSGFFFRHELLAKYKWYWRVEPDVDFSCNIYFDPFVYMIDNNKRYSFTITIKEVAPTVPSLWKRIREFREQYPEVEAQDNAYSFLSDNGGTTYNLCHFWSNFEIADLDFFRSPYYLAFFDYLDQTGNFYYERWGDAPVHSIAAALFLPKHQLHFFNEIGYRHAPLHHCPRGESHHFGQCSCRFINNIDYSGSSCLRRFERLFPQGQVG